MRDTITVTAKFAVERAVSKLALRLPGNAFLKTYVNGTSSVSSKHIAPEGPPARPGVAACLPGPLRPGWAALPHAILSVDSANGLFHRSLRADAAAGTAGADTERRQPGGHSGRFALCVFAAPGEPTDRADRICFPARRRGGHRRAVVVLHAPRSGPDRPAVSRHRVRGDGLRRRRRVLHAR